MGSNGPPPVPWPVVVAFMILGAVVAFGVAYALVARLGG